MTRLELIKQIKAKQTFLCVGLDPDLKRLPQGVEKSPNGVLRFCQDIVDATSAYCVAYKPNVAFFEALGPAGMQAFYDIVSYIPDTHLVIADAKRGDIGNTSRLYAETFFETYACDAITVAPYMGVDSVVPFLAYPNKFVILLALTSNEGSADFQYEMLENGKPLYLNVMQKATEWASPDDLMFVVGATHPKAFEELRNEFPEYFFLVPGVGAQGGDLEAISRHGLHPKDIGLLVNSSRSIIFASDGLDYAHASGQAAFKMQQAMSKILSENVNQS